MNEIIINQFLRRFEPLTLELKLELLARLAESLKKGINKPAPDKNKLLKELFGAWKDVDDDIIQTIYNARTISDRHISFD